jgi:hypothetical protein
MFNAVRQLGGAVGVAVLTTVIVLASHGQSIVTAGASLTPYRVAFLVAAAVALLGVLSALRINDDDAANTIPERQRSTARRARVDLRPGREPARAA